MMFLFIYYLYICHMYEFIVFKLSNGMDKKTLEFVTYCIVAVRNIFLRKFGGKFTKQINNYNVHIPISAPSRNG